MILGMYCKPNLIINNSSSSNNNTNKHTSNTNKHNSNSNLYTLVHITFSITLALFQSRHTTLYILPSSSNTISTIITPSLISSSSSNTRFITCLPDRPNLTPTCLCSNQISMKLLLLSLLAAPKHLQIPPWSLLLHLSTR